MPHLSLPSFRAVTLPMAVLLLVACQAPVVDMSPPTNVTAVPGPGYVTVSWVHSGRGVQQFLVYATQGAGVTRLQLEPVATAGSTERSVDVPGQLDEVATYGVSASTIEGTSDPAWQGGPAVSVEPYLLDGFWCLVQETTSITGAGFGGDGFTLGELRFAGLEFVTEGEGTVTGYAYPGGGPAVVALQGTRTGNTFTTYRDAAPSFEAFGSFTIAGNDTFTGEAYRIYSDPAGRVDFTANATRIETLETCALP